MKKIQIEVKVSSIREAEMFYCTDLGMFEFYHDYGMGNISLTCKDNPSFFLLLKEGVRTVTNMPVFNLEVDNCEAIFRMLKERMQHSNGMLLSDTIFEYPLGKSIALEDPSKNRFVLFEEYL